jgi:DNA-binding beta-propeller fold protein YncE
MTSRKCVVAALVLLALVTAGGRLSGQAQNRAAGVSGLILIDKRGNHVRFFNPGTFEEIGNFSTGDKAPHEVALSGDRRTAYIPIYGDGIINNNPHPGTTLLIVDLAARQLSATIDLSPCQAPHGIQIDAQGLLYVVCDISKTLVVVNPRTRKIEYTVDVEGSGHWLALLPDASKAYVSHQGGAPFISVIDLKARKMIGRIPTMSGGIVAAPDGRRVYAISREPSPATVVVIDPASDKILDRVVVQGHSQPGYKLHVTPDGKTLITSGYEGNARESMINVWPTADLHGTQKVFKAGRGTMGFAIAPDGRTLLLGNDGDGTVTMADLERGEVTRTFKGGVGIENLSYY